MSAAPLPLVLLHGLTDSAACWPSVRARYAGERPVVALDARGHGGSPLPDEPFTVGALAADAAEALAALRLGPAIVVGHSMGGVTAEELAIVAPELVAALVLEDPAWVGTTQGRGRPAWLEAAVTRLAGSTRAELLVAAQAELVGWPEDEVDGWLDAKEHLDPALVSVEHDWAGRDWVEALADVRVPVTLLTGDPARGAVVTPDQAARAEQVLGTAPDGFLTHVAFPGVGHNIRREAREAFLTALAAAIHRADTAAS